MALIGIEELSTNALDLTLAQAQGDELRPQALNLAAADA